MASARRHSSSRRAPRDLVRQVHVQQRHRPRIRSAPRTARFKAMRRSISACSICRATAGDYLSLPGATINMHVIHRRHVRSLVHAGAAAIRGSACSTLAARNRRQWPRLHLLHAQQRLRRQSRRPSQTTILPENVVVVGAAVSANTPPSRGSRRRRQRQRRHEPHERSTSTAHFAAMSRCSYSLQRFEQHV